MRKALLHFVWEDRRLPEGFPAAVSLHSHTQHSWENLRFLHTFRLPVPLIPAVLHIAGRRHRRAIGKELSLERVLWTPPLGAEQAYRLEAEQIRGLGVQPMVSLSDHDDIESGLSLKRQAPDDPAPVSCEWTVPFGPTFFHVGVHNLPPAKARDIAAGMHAYTAAPESGGLGELLEMLHEEAEVLIVLNHPLWDEADIGAAGHRAALTALVTACGRWIHAIELNGLRSWKENSEALELARELRLPAISGGDRHGLEPNANLNLTHARTFGEFAAEVRAGLSHVLFLQQYREPLRLRWFQTVQDIVRTHSGAARERWVDRFFYECEDGVTRPFAALWPDEGPALLRSFFAVLSFSESPGLRAALRLAIADPAKTLL